MSILIKGMEMLKTGVYILSIDNTGKDKTIFTIAEHTNSGKIILCHVGEVVSVPKHGRLIDADCNTFPTLYRNPSNDYARGWNACLKSVQQQPTIIEEEIGKGDTEC